MATPVEILLVDDDEQDIELTCEALKESKVSNHVTTAIDGVEALELLRGDAPGSSPRRPDVILLDLNMPRMDGHTFLEHLKQDADLRNIPVVVLTTSDEESDVLRSYELQAAAFITKPVGLDQIARVVQAIDDFWLQVVRFPLRQDANPPLEGG